LASINTLHENNLLPCLFSFIGDPEVERVNQCWNNSDQIFIHNLTNELRADPLVSRFTPISARNLPNNQWLDATRQAILTASRHFAFKAMDIAPLDLHFKAQFIEDTNLIKIYSRIPGAPALPNLTPAQKAELIRTWIPANQGMLDNIINLHLNGLNLSTIPSEISLLHNLALLDLSHNQLAALPPEIGNLGNLRWLILRYNQLAALPPEIGNLAQLEYLDLENNNLAALPPEIGNLGNLSSLNLKNNQLAALAPEIGNLGNLINLILGNNQLTALPPQIGHLVLLQRLEIENNRLAALPSEIGNLHLQIFDFANNPLILPRLGQFGFNSRIFSLGNWLLNHKAAIATTAAVGLTAIVVKYLQQYKLN